MIEIAALLIGIVTTTLIALTVFAKNNRSITNRLFVGLAISLVGWSLTTYVSLHTSTDQQTLFWMRPIMFFVVLQNTFFFLLVRVFPANQYDLFRRKRYMVAIIFSAVTAIIALSPLLFVDFQDGAPVPGIGMALFLPHALIFAVGGIIGLFIRFFQSKGVEKAQLQYFLAGTVLLYTLVPIGNFVIPVALKLNQLVILSPLYSIVFSALFAYAIVAKRLFDVRAAVARSVGYILSLGFIGLIYGTTVFISFIVLGSENWSANLERVLFVTLALVTATAYPATKRYFEKLTKKLFYRDAYDSQEVLDELSSSLVAEIDLRKVLKNSRNILEGCLKSSFIEYILFEKDETAYKSNKTLATEIEVRQLTAHIRKQNKDLLITDEMSEGNSFKRLFTKNSIALSLRLKTHRQTVGYILFGEKKSGNIYSTQDKKLLTIVANELAIAIQNALRFDEIQKFNITLQKKIEDATAQLRRTNEKLRALDEAKDEFISMASHQLRTPLTSVKGYISMLMEGDAGKLKTSQTKLLEEAFASSQRMVYLIADLLNVSRLKTGKFVIEPTNIFMPKVVQGEIDQVLPTAKAKNIMLTYDAPKNFPMVALDETKIRQVIMNFIDNAIYYTPQGGKIDVQLIAKKDVIEYKVVDNGIGVPKSQQPKLFSKFFRADNAKKARPDGTGLGLYMAGKVVSAQGGSIILISEEGKGSTFGFSFPLDKIQAKKSTDKQETKLHQ